MSLVIWYIVMFVGLIGMIWCAKSQKSVANAKLYAIGCLVVVVISAVMVLVSYFSDPEQERAMANQKQFELSKVNAVAEYVNQKYDGKKVVILIHQDMLPSKEIPGRIDYLDELKTRLKKVTVETVTIKRAPVAEGQEDVEEDASRNLKSFNAMFDECKSFKPAVIIDLAGLPMENASKLKIWKWTGKDDPKLILLSDDDNTSSLVHLKDVLDCVVMTRNDAAKFDWQKDEAPEDLKAAFDSRFVLVTKEKINQLMKDKVISVE